MSVPFWNDLATGIDGSIIRDGFITVPDAPGIGVDLNEGVARRYAKRGEPFF
jgi:L-alanine-DL-glutamate epimerase-like enolase superfamily enzyme